MAVGLLQVRAGRGNVEGDPHHVHPQLPGQLQEVPAALQGAAKRHAGLGRMGLGGQLQQQPGREQTENMLVSPGGGGRNENGNARLVKCTL